MVRESDRYEEIRQWGRVKHIHNFSTRNINKIQVKQAKLDSLGAEKSSIFYYTVKDANNWDKKAGNHNKAEQRTCAWVGEF